MPEIDGSERSELILTGPIFDYGDGVMKVFLIDTEQNRPLTVETVGGLSEWYRLLRCDLIDITERTIGGIVFDVIADDEGLLKPRAKVTGLDAAGQPVLVGNLVFCHSTPEGAEAGLSDEDIALLRRHVVQLTSLEDDSEKWLAVHGIEF